MMPARATQGVTLGDLLAGIADPGAADGLRPLAIEQDSRRLTPESLFLATSGSRHHGLDFVADDCPALAILAEPDARWTPRRIAALALGLGRPVIVVPELSRRAGRIAARFHGDPSASLRVFGITGTNGKTSCAHYLAAASGSQRCATIGTLGYGFDAHLTATANTTSGAVDVQRQLAELRDRGAAWVAMEVSSHALDQHRVAAVRFDTAIFTNLSRDHLDYHGDMRAYGEAKRRLFEQPGLRRAVINLDDPFGRELYGSLPASVEAIVYGRCDEVERAEAAHRVRLRGLQATATGLNLELFIDDSRQCPRVPLIGAFNAANLMAVAGALLGAGVEADEIAWRLAALRGVAGRMQTFGGDGRPLVVVDYAHTPDALASALAALREHASGRLICVFGCGGERDQGKRPLMGELAERGADSVILTDDNPRGEDPEEIARQVLQGMRDPARARREPDRARAICLAVAGAEPGDVVLVAGKGHEDYQLIGSQVRPFSDQAVVAVALAQWRRGAS